MVVEPALTVDTICVPFSGTGLEWNVSLKCTLTLQHTQGSSAAAFGVDVTHALPIGPFASRRDLCWTQCQCQ